jgi:hypothetical protein
VWVIGSIVLHELAHGWAAIRLGDTTPRDLGHMTWNPLVHMGGFSLVVFAVIGIAWGMMPVDPSRLRGRYGDALVALAGPAMNIVLAAVSFAVWLVLWLWLGGRGRPAADESRALLLARRVAEHRARGVQPAPGAAAGRRADRGVAVARLRPSSRTARTGSGSCWAGSSCSSGSASTLHRADREILLEGGWARGDRAVRVLPSRRCGVQTQPQRR